MKAFDRKLTDLQIKTIAALMEGEYELRFFLLRITDKYHHYRVMQIRGKTIVDVSHDLCNVIGCRFTPNLNLSIDGDINTTIDALNERVEFFFEMASGYLSRAEKFLKVNTELLSLSKIRFKGEALC